MIGELRWIDGVLHAGACSTCGGFHRVTESRIGKGTVTDGVLSVPINVRVEPCDHIVVTLTTTAP